LSSIKVQIGDKEYPLTGDENLIRQAADMVNTQLEDIKKHIGDRSPETLSVLVALNIAERKILHESKTENDLNFITDELMKMMDHIDSSFTIED